MIGNFPYAEDASPDFVVVELVRRGAQAGAFVAAPDWVIQTLTNSGFNPRPRDDFMSLAVATGYAVTLATLCGAELTITGDQTVWPTMWGQLLDEPAQAPVRFRRALSH